MDATTSATDPAGLPAAPAVQATPTAAQAHWRASRRLTAALLGIWFAATFVMAFFARELDVVVLGWPLSFYMAAQGSLIVFLVIVVIYARAMDRLDRRHGIGMDIGNRGA